MNTLLHWQFGKKKKTEPLTEPPITVDYAMSSEKICVPYATELALVYYETGITKHLSNTNLLFENQERTIPARSGYYKEDLFWRYWDGSRFIPGNEGICQSSPFGIA